MRPLLVGERWCLSMLFFLLIAGCDKLPSQVQKDDAPPPGAVRLRSDRQSDNNRYQFHATPDGKAFRLDTQTGQTSLVTEKGLMTLPDDRTIQLRVGEIYRLENGKAAMYEGKEKLSSDTRRIADVLVEKHSDGMPTMSAIEAERARRQKDPLGIRK